MGQLFKNVASQKVRVFAFADAGHASLDAGEPVTGNAAQITAQTAVDNAALGASNDVNPDEIDATNAPGFYEFDPTQAETNGSVVEWYPKSSTAGVQVVTVGGNVQTTQPQYLPDLNIASDGDFAGNVDGSVASVVGAVGSVTGAVGSVTGNVGGNVTGSVGSVLGGLNTTAGTITTLDGLDTAQDSQHSTTQGLVTTVDTVANGIKAVTDLLPDAGALTSIATASALSTVGTNVSTLVTKLTTGITSLAEWLGLLAGKQTGDATALTEIRATGAGSGTFDPTTDSGEAIRDTEPLGTAMRGTDSAYTGTPPTAAQNATELLDQAAGVETNRTVRGALRLILSACVGKMSGGATTTNTFRDTNDGKDRITATVDADGNRSAVTLDDS